MVVKMVVRPIADLSESRTPNQDVVRYVVRWSSLQQGRAIRKLPDRTGYGHR
jgi:hypothetical protein